MEKEKFLFPLLFSIAVFGFSSGTNEPLPFDYTIGEVKSGFAILKTSQSEVRFAVTGETSSRSHGNGNFQMLDSMHAIFRSGGDYTIIDFEQRQQFNLAEHLVDSQIVSLSNPRQVGIVSNDVVYIYDWIERRELSKIDISEAISLAYNQSRMKSLPLRIEYSMMCLDTMNFVLLVNDMINNKLYCVKIREHEVIEYTNIKPISISGTGIYYGADADGIRLLSLTKITNARIIESKSIHNFHVFDDNLVYCKEIAKTWNGAPYGEIAIYYKKMRYVLDFSSSGDSDVWLKLR